MTPRLHYLKIWPEPFAAVKAGRKCFEYRKDDRGFAVGDELVLQQWDPHACQGLTAEGKHVSSASDAEAVRALVTYITHGFGIAPGFCCMSIEIVEDDA